MDLNDIATQLEDEAKRLRYLEEKKLLPVQQKVDLKAAHAKLRAALEGQEFSISLTISELKTYTTEYKTKTTSEWCVVLDYKTHSGANLSEAVNKALATLKPEVEGDPETEMAVVEAAFAESAPL